MKCTDCGGEIIEHKKPYYEEEDAFGVRYIVKNVMVMECKRKGCKWMAFSSETCRILEDKREEAQQKLIKSFSIGEFITPLETAKILNIPVQRLSFRRHRCGRMIYKTKLGGKTFYLRKSVELFKKKNDGRFKFK